MHVRVVWEFLSDESSSTRAELNAARAAALVDRFTENCYKLDIDADSWRQKRK